MGAGYVVAIKPSARRINERAGQWVVGHGPTRSFGDKESARTWAAEIADGDETGSVRIQDVAPNDPDTVDGYLVADPARRQSDRHAPDETESAALETFVPDG